MKCLFPLCMVLSKMWEKITEKSTHEQKYEITYRKIAHFHVLKTPPLELIEKIHSHGRRGSEKMIGNKAVFKMHS